MLITKTKELLIRAVAAEAEITQAAAEKAVETVRKAMVDTIMGLGRFQLAGVGVFSLVTRAPREGRNPLTGAPIQIPAKKAVKFKEAAELKRRLNPTR